MRTTVRLVALLTVLTLVACGSSSNNAGSNQHNYLWGLVVNGLGDKGFNDLSYEALQQAAHDFGGRVTVSQSQDQAQFAPELTQLAQANATLVVAVGYPFTDPVKNVAPQFPKIHFAIVDSQVDAPNVTSVQFRQQEGSFLGGIMGGMLTKTNKLGFEGGLQIPPVVSWWAGFAAGVKTVNPSATVTASYVGNFFDPAKGKEVALAEYNAGIDIIFEVSGGSGFGAWEAAKSKGPNFKIFSTDTCKYSRAPDNALADVLKGVKEGTYYVASAVAKGNMTSGVLNLGLKENAMGLCQDTYNKLPSNVQGKIEAAKKLITNGTINVPNDAAGVQAFQPPTLS